MLRAGQIRRPAGRTDFGHLHQCSGDGAGRDGLDGPQVEHMRLGVVAGDGDQLRGKLVELDRRITVPGAGPLAAARSCSNLAA